jgi:hypothetical protein
LLIAENQTGGGLNGDQTLSMVLWDICLPIADKQSRGREGRVQTMMATAKLGLLPGC